MSEQRTGALFPEIWNVPYRHSAYYVGREQEERTAIDKLEQDGVATIGGQRGMGKTQLAAEIAYRQRGNYAGVVWVDATKGVAESCQKIVGSQALPGQNPVQEIDDMLEARGGRRLWVFDGTNQDEMPAELEEPNPNRHVLVINGDLETPDVTVGPLAPEQGAEVVLRRANYLKHYQQVEEASPAAFNSAKNVSVSLDGNPYYLVRAGKYIEDTERGVTGFANLISGEYSQSVMQALEQMNE